VLRELNREHAYAPRRAVHEHVLARLDLGLAKEAQRRVRAERQRRRFFERHIGRLCFEHPRFHAQVFGVRTECYRQPEHAIAGAKSNDGFTD
jgi:hypothetical protein